MRQWKKYPTWAQTWRQEMDLRFIVYVHAGGFAIAILMWIFG